MATRNEVAEVRHPFAKTMLIFVLTLLVIGCSGPGNLYRSVYGNWLTLKKDNHFEYKDVIPMGHDDLYVHAQGIYYVKSDTLHFTYLIDNLDSLSYNGRKIVYKLPGYVVKKGNGFLLLTKNDAVRFLERNPKL